MLFVVWGGGNDATILFNQEATLVSSEPARGMTVASIVSCKEVPGTVQVKTSRLTERAFEFDFTAVAVCLRCLPAALDWRLVVDVVESDFDFDLRVFELEEADLTAASSG